MRIPRSVEYEHDELHHDLDVAAQLGGRTGEAAKQVARILQPHFLRENDYAVPPLGLLERLTRGGVTADMAAVLPMVDRLKAELPQMLKEHQALVGALEEFSRAATAEGHDEWVHFADRLRRHAQMEEEVLYPAAILVGEYVRLRLGR